MKIGEIRVMSKKYKAVIIILALIIIAIVSLLYSAGVFKKQIELSQEVKDNIDFSVLSHHVDKLLKNGFDYDGQYDGADLYAYRHSSRGFVQLFLYSPTEKKDIDSQYSFHVKWIEYEGDNCIFIFINDQNAGKLRMWVDYDDAREITSAFINKILYELFTEYSLLSF